MSKSAAFLLAILGASVVAVIGILFGTHAPELTLRARAWLQSLIAPRHIVLRLPFGHVLELRPCASEVECACWAPIDAELDALEARRIQRSLRPSPIPQPPRGPRG